jgi:hypothetical protein
MQEHQDVRAGRTPSAWVGWVVFAGTIAIIGGIFNIIQGLVALFDDQYFVVAKGDLLLLDFTTWGWIHVLVGVVMLLVGLGIIRGSPWGLVAGVVIAGVQAILQLGFLAAYPVWSILIIALDVVVIYALIVHGRELADR